MTAASQLIDLRLPDGSGGSAGPDPVAAAEAWRRIEAFFGEHLAASQ
ncbi:hypothetical protein [Cryobacterium lyxosi]|nr:hypothetical protein [Cryobacterium lyxosi]